MRVLLGTRDLLFRSKLGAVAAAAGAEVVAADADLVVLEVEAPGAVERIRGLVELLRAAREAGATAVPNSQVEEALRQAILHEP